MLQAVGDLTARRRGGAGPPRCGPACSSGFAGHGRFPVFATCPVVILAHSKTIAGEKGPLRPRSATGPMKRSPACSADRNAEPRHRWAQKGHPSSCLIGFQPQRKNGWPLRALQSVSGWWLERFHARVSGGRLAGPGPSSGEGKGSLLNNAFLTPKPPASSVYVRVPEPPSPLKRSISVTSLFPCPLVCLTFPSPSVCLT